MIKINDFINLFSTIFPGNEKLQPWEITTTVSKIIELKIRTLDSDYFIENDIAIHKSAKVEERAILKGPLIIDKNCFVGSNAYLRNGVYLGESSSIGPACEVKSSIILNDTEIAHLNFIGDSILGSHINCEAGSIAANYYNERVDKKIKVLAGSTPMNTNVDKFGSLIGDNCKIGANAVLSPGTILVPGTIVKRLELVEQLKER
jgi:NDP-sugar pyrophosphorylase family protein